jgi:hypothetical protein
VTVHIAGFPVRIGTLRRQRCAWCEAVLIDLDLRQVAVPEGDDIEPRFWETGELIQVESGDGFTAQTLVTHKDGDPLPREACGFPAVAPVSPSLRVVR